MTSFEAYDKLNTNFLNNDLQIARIDVVQLSNADIGLEPQTTVFHATPATTTTEP